MLDFLKKLFGSNKKVKEEIQEIKTEKREKLTAEMLEAEPEMQVAVMIATIEAAGEKDLSNFRVRKVRKF